MIKYNPQCQCADSHEGDEDHAGPNDKCPRVATGNYGGVWLCDECANAEVVD
jgi:hypothetical protein